jgi:hypothetical protein
MFVRVLKTLTFALSFISFLIGLFGVVAVLNSDYGKAFSPIQLFPYMLAGFIVMAVAGWLMIMTVIIEKKRT